MNPEAVAASNLYSKGAAFFSLLLGHPQLRAGNYEAAVEALNALKAKNPDDPRVQLNILIAQYCAEG